MPELILLDQAQSPTAEKIWRLNQRAYRVEAGLLGVCDFPPLRRSAEDIQQSGNRFYGLVEMSELLAAAELEEFPRAKGKTLVINSFIVTPDRFRLGLGSQLLQGILGIADAVCLRIETAAQNLPAIALYKKFGFTELSRRKNREGYEIVTLELIKATSS
ncbi:MAG: GNAT family N-acetyltransferase [Proteobacteria bacterium]|nr:GNAT family N-acetyltransferase [Pseudomonadota bacterium]